MREQRQLDRIYQLLENYKGELPLQHYLRNYFRQHHEMGANDRRLTSQFIYNWYRLGTALPDLKKEERLAVASFLVMDKESSLFSFLLQSTALNNNADLTAQLSIKLSVVQEAYPQFNLQDVFPFLKLASEKLNITFMTMNILKQPYLWLRVKRNMETPFITCLESNSIQYVKQGVAVGIRNSTDLSKIPGLNPSWYEVQDYSSQLTGNYFKPQKGDHWYDCCAASGGKSLLLHGLEPGISLTVSDNREKILSNLKTRFEKNGIINYKMELVDLGNMIPKTISQNQFDGIIADIPCTGSGTWSRSPEHISFFNEADLLMYTERQKKIISHVSPLLKAGKPLIYITCSVFKAENEEMVDWIIENCDFELESSALIEGADFYADTMFVARLIKK